MIQTRIRELVGFLDSNNKKTSKSVFRTINIKINKPKNQSKFRISKKDKDFAKR